MSPSDPPRPRSGRKAFQDLTRFGGLGATMAACIAILGGLGYWLDGLVGTSPVLLLAGIFAGAAGGFVHIVRSVK